MELFRCNNCQCLIRCEDSLCPYCGNIVIIPRENVKKPKTFKTEKFSLIIRIITLLIALLGATFAYFSATVRSGENDVTVKSAYVSIQYDGGTKIEVSNLTSTTKNR